MTKNERDIGFPETPGLADAVDRMNRAYDNADKRQAKADARRRIEAAAPAMLDALRKIRAEIMAWADDDNPDGAPSPNELAARIAVTARAAIVAADPTGEAASAAAARFRNSYYCEECGTTWQDESAHVCDDRCPACDASCSPSESEDILPGNAPCSASEEIPHHDEAESPIVSEAAPEAEIDTIAEPVAGMWRARLATPNFTFEAFALDIASARRALEQGLIRHAWQYGLEPGWWHDFAGGIKIYFVRAGAAYCDGELIRERGYDD